MYVLVLATILALNGLCGLFFFDKDATITKEDYVLDGKSLNRVCCIYFFDKCETVTKEEYIRVLSTMENVALEEPYIFQ